MLTPLRVLIADDDWMLSVCLKSMIGSLGHHVVGTASTGQQAIEMALAEGPDLIFMDVQMPVLDGLAATRQLMLTRPTAIIVISAEAASAARGEAAGAMHSVVKPICGPELSSLLEQAVRRFTWFLTLSANSTSHEEALRLWLAFREAVAANPRVKSERALFERLSGTPAGRAALARAAQHITVDTETTPPLAPSGTARPVLAQRPT